MESIEEININEIWQNNVNLLIGSSASYGLFPTLETDMDGESTETLRKYFEGTGLVRINSNRLISIYKENSGFNSESIQTVFSANLLRSKHLFFALPIKSLLMLQLHKVKQR